MLYRGRPSGTDGPKLSFTTKPSFFDSRASARLVTSSSSLGSRLDFFGARPSVSGVGKAEFFPANPQAVRRKWC